MKKHLMILALAVICFSCKKSSDDDTPTPTPAPTAAKSFENLSFDATHAFFSTNGSMTAPVDSTHAFSISNKIDITYIYNFDYDEPGFFDPVARSQSWYWHDYYRAWLSNGVVTRYYGTSLTRADFDAAKADQSKIGTYFTGLVLAPHSIFPVGSCIGGRVDFTAGSLSLYMDAVFAFKNTASGKRGLIYIRNDQPLGWPNYIVSNGTKVDIIREN